MKYPVSRPLLYAYAPAGVKSALLSGVRRVCFLQQGQTVHWSEVITTNAIWTDKQTSNMKKKEKVWNITQHNNNSLIQEDDIKSKNFGSKICEGQISSERCFAPENVWKRLDIAKAKGWTDRKGMFFVALLVYDTLDF